MAPRAPIVKRKDDFACGTPVRKFDTFQVLSLGQFKINCSHMDPYALKAGSHHFSKP